MKNGVVATGGWAGGELLPPHAASQQLATATSARWPKVERIVGPGSGGGLPLQRAARDQLWPRFLLKLLYAWPCGQRFARRAAKFGSPVGKLSEGKVGPSGQSHRLFPRLPGSGARFIMAYDRAQGLGLVFAACRRGSGGVGLGRVRAVRPLSGAAARGNPRAFEHLASGAAAPQRRRDPECAVIRIVGAGRFPPHAQGG